MTAVDLELTLRPAGHGYHAEARCRPPGSDAPIDAAATVQIDPARLRELALDPTAYGLALGQMVLVDTISRISWCSKDSYIDTLQYNDILPL